MRDVILIDLDHTICDSFWRDQMVGVAPWDVYHMELEHDDPAHDLIEFMSLVDGHDRQFIGITSRPEKFRQLTMLWMMKHNVMFLDDILMRPNNDFRTAHEVKISLCEERFGENWQDRILCLIDDNDRVIEAFRGAGVTCLQVFNKRGEK